MQIFPPFLQTRDRLTHFYLIFHFSSPYFLTHHESQQCQLQKLFPSRREGTECIAELASHGFQKACWFPQHHKWITAMLAPSLQLQSGQDKLCTLPSALFPPVKILEVFSWEGTKDWNHPAGLLEHVADMRTLSTCTFGPWKDCACQDWGTHQLLAGTFWAEDMAGSAHSRKYWK